MTKFKPLWLGPPDQEAPVINLPRPRPLRAALGWSGAF